MVGFEVEEFFQFFKGHLPGELFFHAWIKRVTRKIANLRVGL
jgi:hypothetical protein